jgi:ABC-type nitrate/sulfonate/bicarbonate transport system permease component
MGARPALPALMPRTAGAWRRAALGAAGLLAAVACWQWYSGQSPDNVFVASSPQRAWDTLAGLLSDRSFWTVQVSATAQGLAAGWACAVASGLALGVIMGASRHWREALEPLLFAVNCVPRLALIPLFTLWLGYGLVYKTVVVAAAGFFPVLLNTTAGVSGAERQLVQMSRSFGASRRDQLLTVSLPGSLPMIFAGLRQSLAQSIAGVIGAEIWASSAGLGWLIANGEQDVRTDQVIAPIVVVTVIGVVLTELLAQAETRCLRWHRSWSG